MLNSIVKQLDVITRKYPNKVAIRSEDESISFLTYRNVSRTIATNLHGYTTKKGVIAVYLPKSIQCLTVLMGILYSGNCYCPIPFASPIERAERIISKSQPLCVVTDMKNVERVSCFMLNREGIILIEDLLKGVCNDNLIDNIISRVIDNDPAYLLFTSGSTGMPKGVTVPHRAITDYIQWSIENFELNEDTVLASQAPFHFDASMPDIYTPLFTGAELVLIKEKLFMFPAKLIKYLNDMCVNTLIWVPSALMILTTRNVFERYRLLYLKIVMFCGEVMPNKHLNIWRKYNPQVVFVNLYGPTEAAYASTYYIVKKKFEDDEILPIGYPCMNTEILILDEHDELIKEVGKIGEICIRGSSLALGYYGDKGNNAFVQNPMNKLYADLIYRTGDLGSMNEYQELVYVGRKDTQIKHMGYRIELGEIEAAVMAITYIKTSCVLYDSHKDEIVLFYEEDENHELSELIEKLSSKLPSYMQPGNYQKLDSMPYNLNGKIDRLYLKAQLERKI